ncbi:unnamed protein product [Amoebophrya sp. A25]|nr:unnamed protein product [Amoebophrya sp. A25]|eukprot:GSA25T00001166001.1
MPTIASLAVKLKIKKQQAYPFGERLYIGILALKLAADGKGRGRLHVPSAARIIFQNPQVGRKYIDLVSRCMEMGRSEFSHSERKDLFRNFTAEAIKSLVAEKFGKAEIERLRAPGGGRKVINAGLHEDLFDLFLHMRTLGTKTTRTLMMQVAMELGKQKRDARESVPVITRDWVTRWALSYGLALRMPNSRPKLTEEEAASRVLPTWKTSWAVLTFLRRLGYEVRIRALDEKPLFMNSTSEGKILAQSGSRTVTVCEAHGQTRSRYTMLTQCVDRIRPGLPSPPTVEVLFRGGDNVKSKLDAARQNAVNGGDLPDRALVVRTGPKGSYTREIFQTSVDQMLDRDPPAASEVDYFIWDHYRGHMLDQEPLVEKGGSG